MAISIQMGIQAGISGGDDAWLLTVRSVLLRRRRRLLVPGLVPNAS
ncbi:MAG: hypothetical protein J0652_13060 [Desulfobulbaceae bacterium]|nr:hypothetical protein [Desulfobulbaceae bacterium]